MVSVFRDLVRHWETTGALTRVTRTVSPRYEVAAVASRFKGARPLLFSAVEGIPYPVVIGLGGDRSLVAESVGAPVAELPSRLMRAIVHPLPTETVASAPVQEVELRPPFDIGNVLPGLVYHARDAGPYYVLGVLLVKSPDGARRYTSVRRMQILPGNRVSIVITSQELWQQFLRYEAEGRPLEVAVMFGVVPAVVVASQVATHLFHVDKLDVASALLGTPLPVVRCRTVDLEVLASAEWVLEGRILPHVRVPEGPFGELGGYYSQPGPQPVVEISAVTHRRDPIIQTVMPGSYEERLPGVINREMFLLQTIRQVVPGARAVHVTMGGMGRFHVVVQIEKREAGDGKEAALAAFAADKDVKHVVVVDEDVDPFDLEDVEWAIATRVQADRDVFIVPGARGSPLEASHHLTGTTAKVGVDATVPLTEREAFQRIRVPGRDELDLKAYGLA
jgi:2,5-furandicarboxylate decarboxylase 1